MDLLWGRDKKLSPNCVLETSKCSPMEKDFQSNARCLNLLFCVLLGLVKIILPKNTSREVLAPRDEEWTFWLIGGFRVGWRDNIKSLYICNLELQERKFGANCCENWLIVSVIFQAKRLNPSCLQPLKCNSFPACLCHLWPWMKILWDRDCRLDKRSNWKLWWACSIYTFLTFYKLNHLSWK